MVRDLRGANGAPIKINKHFLQPKPHEHALLRWSEARETKTITPVSIGGKKNRIRRVRIRLKQWIPKTKKIKSQKKTLPTYLFSSLLYIALTYAITSFNAESYNIYNQCISTVYSAYTIAVFSATAHVISHSSMHKINRLALFMHK